MSKTIYAIGTLDSKGSEMNWLCQRLKEQSQHVVMVDVGTLSSPVTEPDITREQVLGRVDLPKSGHRGDNIRVMGEALRSFLLREVEAERVGGVIGIGGSGGTSLITTAMRSLPIGLPKLMVSTVASGNTAPYIDCSDITMMYSVVDVAGLNVVSKAILSNAANAISGMVAHHHAIHASKATLGMTMFGVTTPCVTQVREALEKDDYDCLVFHATGTGGRAMERLVASDLIQGVIDITATEVADEIAGGIFPAGKERYDILLEKEVPLVLSLGAIDMVNFGNIKSVPESYQNRNLHVHNPQVTLMRTNVDENIKIAKWIAKKLNQSRSPWTLLFPEKGVSSLSVKGQPFHDPEADRACMDTLEAELEINSDRKIIKVQDEINSSDFASQVVTEFKSLVSKSGGLAR